MMSTGVFSLFLLAAFVDCGNSFDLVEVDDIFPFDQVSHNNEVEKKFLENNILRGIDNEHLCGNPYTAVCGKNSLNYTRPFHLKRAYPNIRNRLINILSQPRDHHQVLALSIEKAIFSNCMNLGLKDDKRNVEDTMSFIRSLFRKISQLAKEWQEVDNMLNLRGFDFSFFDIGVEHDPEKPTKNIIVLQPPLPSYIEDIFELMQIVFDPLKPHHISKSLVYEYLDSVRDQKAVRKFFRKWTKILSQSSSNQKQEKMNLTEWNVEFYNSTDKTKTSTINWRKLFKQNFERADVVLDKNESMIVRNKNYFISMADLLSNTPNNVIVAVIKAKLILGNIRYIDYKYADAIRHRKKSLFCLSSTKLHGGSYQLLRELAKEDPNNEQNIENIDIVIHNIASVFVSAIDDSKSLKSEEKTYLKAQVKWITYDGINYRNYGRDVDRYIIEFSLDTSYFVSIVDYRKMLKEKELNLLPRHAEFPIGAEPFSIVDLSKPRNRFIVSVLASSFLLAKQPIPRGLDKEVHYGIYGTKIASFLYGLLNENRFDNEVSLIGRVHWYDHPDYPAETLQCFVGEDVKSYGRSLATETVSQIFGTRIAYKAMLHDYSVNYETRPFSMTSSYSKMKHLFADQLFFVAYGKYNCNVGRRALKTILLNLAEYKTAFDCGSLQGSWVPSCPLKSFEIQTKEYFVNQPFL